MVMKLVQSPRGQRRSRPSPLPILLLMAATGCTSEDPTGAMQPGTVEIGVGSLSLGGSRTGSFTVRNPGGLAVGPVVLTPTPIQGPGGTALPGSALVLTPTEISTLNPGESRLVALEVALGGTVQPGTYGASVVATAPDGGDGAGPVEARLSVDFQVADFEGVEGVTDVRIAAPGTTVRQGDATGFTVHVQGQDGEALEGVPVGWSLDPPGAGFVAGNGLIVGYEPGPVSVIARVGALADTLALDVTARGLTGAIVPVGTGIQENRRSSDLWAHGDYVYIGTHVGGVGGNTLFVWDVSDPASPLKTDSVVVDARVVNDVKVRADGRLAVMTHEGSNDGKNGVTLLDLDDPAHPAVIGRVTDQLESGVHNAWLDGEHLYLVADGSGVGLRVFDISEPSDPKLVATFAGSETTFLHDVYVRNGLAFLSHWNAGLIVLDVGNGIMGGSPGDPREVSRILTTGGQTHNAWYWPDAGYVFVGEEDFATPGIMHVVDFRDPTRPAEVATFAVAGQTPHNFWLDEDRGALYLAWYGNGVRVLDVGGELAGELDKQGREIASIQHLGSGGCSSTGTCTWAPQFHRGLLFVSDMTRGLSVLEPIL